jgi:hypothetical protein
MRAIRVFVATAPLLVAACAAVAGLDSYTQDDSTGTTGDAGGGRSDGNESSDGSVANQGDGGAIPLRDGSQVVEASISNDPGDATDDTGPPIVGCMLIQNGSQCDKDANACCSGICNEGHTCTNNQCISGVGSGCANGLSYQVGYVLAKDNCCVNTFCSPNAGVADKGMCQQCVPSQGLTPARQVPEPVFGNVQVVYEHACCSGKTPNPDGTCP